MQVPNIAWLPHRINLLLGKLPITGGFYMGADWEHLHWFTKSSLLELLLVARALRLKQYRVAAYLQNIGDYGFPH